ncbi:MAG: TIM barrel protein [Altererythrobacter sp.]
MELADVARAAGCDALCLFLHAMEVLPLMPQFDLVKDRSHRQHLRLRMDDLGLELDLAYPFTLGSRSEIAHFVPLLECAAELDASLVNVLVYDRDPARREDRFAAFCELAASFGLRVAVEFFPASQVRSLAEAIALVQPIGKPGLVGINADLLHLMRSGGTCEELAGAPAGTILYGQFADGPAYCDEADWEREASSARMVGGEGDFDLTAFAKALPPGCPASVEIPRDWQIQAGVPRSERVAIAMEGVRRALRR